MKPALNIFAASLTGLLLVLSAIAAATMGTKTGLPLYIAQRSAYPPGVLCIEQRTVVVRIDADRNLFLNYEPVTRAALKGRLYDIFKTRAEPLAYVLGASELSYGDVAETIDQVRAVVPTIGLLTPATFSSKEPLLHINGPRKWR